MLNVKKDNLGGEGKDDKNAADMEKKLSDRKVIWETSRRISVLFDNFPVKAREWVGGLEINWQF